MNQTRERTIRWQDPLEAARRGMALSGLGWLQAIVRGELPQPPISESLSFRLVEVEDGAVEFRGEPGEHVYNAMGTVHGGWAATLLDSALGCAVMSKLDEATAYATMQLNVNLTAPITTRTGEVRVRARVVHLGRSAATAEAEIHDARGHLLAHGTTVCMLMKRPGTA